MRQRMPFCPTAAQTAKQDCETTCTLCRHPRDMAVQIKPALLPPFVSKMGDDECYNLGNDIQDFRDTVNDLFGLIQIFKGFVQTGNAF